MTASPPTKKPITATREGSWKLASPLIAWPDVHPPAYRAPKPTKKPPPRIITSPGKEASPCQEINSAGTSPEKLVMPMSSSAVTVEGERSMLPPGVASMTVPMKPPIMMPATNVKFHNPVFFQSYFRNSRLDGKVAAHICLKLEDTPNCLPLKIKSAGTNKPIMGPATYQGQGWERISIIVTKNVEGKSLVSTSFDIFIQLLSYIVSRESILIIHVESGVCLLIDCYSGIIKELFDILFNAV